MIPSTLIPLSALAWVPAAAAFAPAAPGEADTVRYVDATIEPDGVLLGAEFVDVDLDGRPEICLAVRTPDGRRELRVHRVESRAAAVSPEPFAVVEVLDDALAYGFADVRSEPGRELFFLTRSGAFSYSLELDGYRGNVRRLVRSDLVYDVPNPRGLRAFEYVLHAPEGKGNSEFDRLLLPGREGYAIWSAPTGDNESPFVAEASFPLPIDSVNRRVGGEAVGRDTQVSFGPGGLVITRDDSLLPAPFLSERAAGVGSLLSAGSSYEAPALLDVNGDGRRDLMIPVDEGLAIHLAGEDGAFSDEPTRTEALPDEPDAEDENFDLFFHDLDGDPYPDVVLLNEKEGDGLENGVITIRFFGGERDRLVSEQPRQVMRFEAAQLRYEIADINGDGTPDLAIREFKLPSLMETVTGLEFTLTHLVYLGERGGSRPFERKPTLRHTETYDENTIQEAIKNRELTMDCDGDGICDMVEVDFQGRIAIRRLSRRKSFFGGATWGLDETPWRRFEVAGNIESVEVRDLNGDGLGDIVSEGRERLTLLLSSRGGSR